MESSTLFYQTQLILSYMDLLKTFFSQFLREKSVWDLLIEKEIEYSESSAFNHI